MYAGSEGEAKCDSSGYLGAQISVSHTTSYFSLLKAYYINTMVSIRKRVHSPSICSEFYSKNYCFS